MLFSPKLANLMRGSELIGRLFCYKSDNNACLTFYTVIPGNSHKVEYGIYVRAPALLFVVKLEYLEGWMSSRDHTEVEVYVRVLTSYAHEPERLRTLYIPLRHFLYDLENGSLVEAVPEDE